MGSGASSRSVLPETAQMDEVVPNNGPGVRKASSRASGTFAAQVRGYLKSKNSWTSHQQQSESLLTDPEYDYMQNFSVVESDIERLERTMRTILFTPALCNSFKRFLANQFSEQKLMFWLDVQALRKYRLKRLSKKKTAAKRGGWASNSFGGPPDSPGYDESPEGFSSFLGRKLFGKNRELIIKAQHIYTRYIFDSAEKRVDLDGATIDEIEQTLQIRLPEGKVTETREFYLREAFKEAQQKIFHSLLFDHLAGFLASQFFSQAQSTLTDDRAVTEINAVQEAVETKQQPTTGLTDTIVTNPFCSYFLHQFLETLPPPSNEKKKKECRSVPAVELLECLSEINDFQSSPDPAHRQRRAHTIIRRYGTEEIGCAPLLEMQNDLMAKPRKFHNPDVSLFDGVYTLLANILMADYLNDFLKSKFYADMEHQLVTLQQSGSQLRYKQMCEKLELVADEQFGVKPQMQSPHHAPLAPGPVHTATDCQEEKGVPLKGVLPPVIFPGQKSSTHGSLAVSSSISDEFMDAAFAPGTGSLGIVQQVSLSSEPHSPHGSEGPRSRLCSSTSGNMPLPHHQKDDETWKHLLEDPLGVSLFKKFSIRNLQDENIRFWIQVRHFKNENYINPPEGHEIVHDENQNNMELRMLRALNIGEVFIKEGAELQVNVSAKCRQKILQALKDTEQVDLNIFDEAHKEIEYLMKANLWAKFKATPMYTAYKQKEMKDIERLHLKHLAERNKRKMDARSPNTRIQERKNSCMSLVGSRK